MQLAYTVHGALAMVSPYDIPREYKIQIRRAIECLERDGRMMMMMQDVVQDDHYKVKKRQ